MPYIFLILALFIPLNIANAALTLTTGVAAENDRILHYHLIRHGNTELELTVRCATMDDTAIAGVHYVATASTVTFPAGQTSAQFDIPLIDNGIIDGDKSFKVFITSLSGVLLSNPPSDEIPWCDPPEWSGLIRDNELPLTRLDPIFVPELEHFAAKLANGQFIMNAGSAGLVKLNPDGSVDSSFVPGINTVDGLVRLWHVFENGVTLVSREFEPNSPSRSRLMLLDANGAVKQTLAAFGETAPLHRVEHEDRLLLALCADGNHTTLFRITSDGLDPEFQEQTLNGLVFIPPVLQEDGIVLVVFTPDKKSILIRLHSNGSMDSNWNRTEFSRHVVPILQRDRSLLVRPSGIESDGTYRASLTRLNSDGTSDASFQQVDDASEIFVRSDGAVIVPKAEGFVVVDGPIVRTNGLDGRILNFKSSHVWLPIGNSSFGSRFDVNFYTPPPPCNISVGLHPWDGILRLADFTNRLLVPGNFSKVDGFPRSRVVRLVLDTPPQPDFRVLTSEISGATGTAIIQVVRTGESTRAASVDFSMLDDAAKAGMNYIPQIGTLRFAPLEISKQINVPILSKAGTVSLSLQLINPSAGYSSPGLIPIRVRTLRIAAESFRRGNPLTIEGTLPGSTYSVETSTDLRKWSGIGVQGMGTGGILRFPALLPLGPNQFYRVIQF